MKVLDLQCRLGHVFEGWFASEDDFQRQSCQSLVQCPFCADVHISKRLSAPRLNFGAWQTTSQLSAPSVADVPSANSAVEVSAVNMHAAWLSMARQFIAAAEDVGSRFAQEARRIHNGEAEERVIYGQASPEEAKQLLDDGIAVLPLLLPEAAKETLQ